MGFAYQATQVPPTQGPMQQGRLAQDCPLPMLDLASTGVGARIDANRGIPPAAAILSSRLDIKYPNRLFGVMIVLWHNTTR